MCDDDASLVRLEHVDPAPVSDVARLDQSDVMETQNSYVKQQTDMRSILVVALQGNLECFYCQAMKHKNGILDQDDWTALYQHNRRLYINFVFGRYLAAPDAESKILWLTCETVTQNLNSLGYYDSDQALANLQLFGNDSVMQNVYEGFARSLGSINISPEDKDHLAQIFFFYQGNLYLRNRQAVCDRLTSAFGRMSEMGRKQISLQDFYEVGNTLNAMASMFDYSSLAGDFSSDYFKLTGPQDNSVVLSISSEESLWLVQRKDDMINTKNTVPFGLEVTMEFSNFALTSQTISHEWNVRTNQVFKERLWRFFKMHSEFEKFSDNEQRLIWSSCYDLFASLLAVRLGGAPMNDQAEFMFSSHEITANTFLKVIHQSSPKEAEGLNAIDMKDVFPAVPKEWNDTARRVKSFVRRNDDNMTFFALLTSALFDLSSIGDQVVGESKTRWEALGSAYRQLISRQFARTQPDFEEMLSSAITDLKMLSLMMMVPVSQD